eukprot:jgi/Mesen1/7105/ME000369S06428
MGKGGDGARRETGLQEVGRTSFYEHAPNEKPPFTVGDLKKAIPPHCFERSLPKSLAYLAVDLIIIYTLYRCTSLFDHPAVPAWVSSFLLWPAYVIAQGSVATGVWVIAHECGHQAFSDYGWVNDTVGMVMHTALLVPYFSWKYSHRRHHSNTGCVQRDEVFIPKRKERVSEAMMHPLYRVMTIVVSLSIGWPMYLAFNKSGRKYDGFANHFLPSSPIFNDRERFFVGVSDVGLAAMLLALFKVYVAPLMVVNMFLVLITLLQHTHPSLPHYELTEWDWLRGALATEATEAIKPILGKYYQMDRTPVALALWREIRDCAFVEPDPKNPGVLWYTPKAQAFKQASD